jgi:hypothetical protein
LFGPEEYIFCQFIFTCSALKGTKGEQAPIPKDDCKNKNEKRPNYTKIESAIKVNGTAGKNPLVNSSL